MYVAHKQVQGFSLQSFKTAKFVKFEGSFFRHNSHCGNNDDYEQK